MRTYNKELVGKGQQQHYVLEGLNIIRGVQVNNLLFKKGKKRKPLRITLA